MPDPLWLNDDGAGSPAYDGRELRRAMAALLVQGVADRFGARSGLHPAGSDAVTISGMTVTVRDLKGVVYPTGASLRGPYIVQLPSKTHTVPTADPSLPRKDMVELRIRDDAEDSSGLRQADTEYKTGTPAATPSEPAVDTDAVRIASVDVPAGSTTPTLTYNAPWYGLHTGILPVANQTDIDAIVSGIYNGFYVDNQAVGLLERWSGAAWKGMAIADPYVASDQVSQPPFDVTATWTDFTASAWPTLQYVVPPSGIVHVTLSARLGNNNSPAATCRLGFRLSGGVTLSTDFDRSITSQGATSTEQSYSRVIRLTGQSPGGTVTLTPAWYISSGTATDAKLTGGQILVERIP